MGFALVSGSVYYLAATKFVDYSQTQLQFASARSAFVSRANVTPDGGGWSIHVRWRFVNDGRLPLMIAIFTFQVYVDNGSDPRPWYDGGKLASEVSALLSFQADRLTGIVVEPSSFEELNWTAHVPPQDAARVVPHTDDGKFHLAFLNVRIVHYIDDVDNRQVQDLDPFILAVAP